MVSLSLCLCHCTPPPPKTSVFMENFGFGMCTPCPAPPCTALHPSALRTGHRLSNQLLYLQAPWDKIFDCHPPIQTGRGTVHGRTALSRSAIAPHAAHCGELTHRRSFAAASITAALPPLPSHARLMESAGFSADCTQQRVSCSPVQRRRWAILRRMRCCWTLPAPALPQRSWASAPMLSPTSTRRRARRACASSSATSVPHSSAACWVVTHAGHSDRSAPPGPQEPTQ